MIDDAQRLRADLSAVTANVVTAHAGDSLESLMAASPTPIVTENGAFFDGFTIPSGRSITFGAGAGAAGLAGPALRVRPGTTGQRVGGGIYRTLSTEAVVQVGENTTNQATAADQPTDIVLDGLHVPTFRGKRAYALHAFRITLTRSSCADVFSKDPTADSQGVYIGNAAGEIDITFCDLEAGSEIILSGGDELRTPGLHPRGVRIKNNVVRRRVTLRTNAEFAASGRLKNMIELKDALDVEITDNVCSGNWNDPRVTQGCFAIVLTPALDGAKSTPPKNSGLVGNVLIARNTLVDTGGGIQIIGRHYTAITDPALYGVKIRDNRFRISKAQNGGFGQFMKIGGEPNDIEVSDNLVLQDGSSHVYTYKGDVLDPLTGISRPGGPIGSFSYNGNVAELGLYSFNIDGTPNALVDKIGLNMLKSEFGFNTFKGAARKGPYGGVYLADADFELRDDVRALRAFVTPQ
jgi:hypothetical protein